MNKKSMFKLLRFKIKQKPKPDICIHAKVGMKIRRIILIAIILAITFLTNFFSIPFFWIAHGTERIEFGLIIPFVLIGIIKFSWLLVVVLFLPILDQLIHSHHNVLTIPLEMFFNFCLLIGITFFWENYFKKKTDKKIIWVQCFFCLVIVITLILKLFYLRFFFFFFLRGKEPTFSLKEIWPILLATTFKFSVIFFFTMSIKKNINQKRLIQI